MKDWNEAHLNGHSACVGADQVWVNGEAPTVADQAFGHGAGVTRPNLKRFRRRAFAAQSSSSADVPGGKLPDMSIVNRNQIAAPPFPLEIFGPAADWVQTTAESKSAPVEYVAISTLAVVASCIGAKRRASPWESWEEPAIFWSALVGPPSFSKSPAADPHRNAVRRVEEVQNADWEDRKAAYEKELQAADLHRGAWEQELAKAIKNGDATPDLPKDAREPTKPNRRRMLIGDATTEKVAHLLSENPGGLLCIRDELAGLLGGFDKYGGSGSDRAFWLEAYGGRPHRYDRMKLEQAVDIPFCAVSLLGAIQPDRLHSMLLSGDDDGLLSRFIFAWPDVAPSRRPTRFADEQSLVDALQRLSSLQFALGDDKSIHPRVVLLEVGAADEFQVWWERTQWDAKMSATGRVQGAIGKLDGVALRLALIIEYLIWAWRRGNSSEPETISTQSVRSAIALIEQWVRPTLARVFAEASQPQVHRDAMCVARWLLKAKPRPEVINARELRRQAGFPGPKDVKHLDAALEFLAEARWLARQPHAGQGRPRKDFDVNPLVYPQEVQ